MVTSDLDVSVKDKENAKTYANTYRNLRPIKGSPILALTILSLITVYREKSLSWGAYSRSQHSQHNKQVQRSNNTLYVSLQHPYAILGATWITNGGWTDISNIYR